MVLPAKLRLTLPTGQVQFFHLPLGQQTGNAYLLALLVCVQVLAESMPCLCMIVAWCHGSCRHIPTHNED